MRGGRACVTALFCAAALAASVPASAQLSENISGLTHQNLKGYLSPLNTALSGMMSSAIFRTGYVPRKGVNISGGLVAMAIGFDDQDKTFIPTDPVGFTSLAPTRVPTVAGSSEGVTVEGANGLSHSYPGGFDLEGMELAAPQISIGSYYGTRAVVRYFALDVGDSDFGKFSHWGFGAQHSISQWVPKLPFDLAAGFMVQGLEIGEDVVKARTTHFGVTASRKFYKYLQPYAGLGVDTIRLHVKHDDDDPDDEIDDSFDVQFDTKTDPRVTLGLAARAPYVAAFLEISSAAATDVAVGLSFGN